MVQKTGKVLAWMLASLLLLILLVFILIQIPAVQNYGRKKLVSYLENKLKTKVEIGKLSIAFPKQIVLERVYLQDKQKDTLLYAEKLQVDISLLKLISSEVQIKYVALNGITANIYRRGTNTFFNYDYIVKAFAGTDSATKKATSPGFGFNVDKMELNRVHGQFTDDQTGNDVAFSIGHFETFFKTFDPFKLAFNLPNIQLSDTKITVQQYKPLFIEKPMAVIQAESNTPSSLALKLGSIQLKNVGFIYANKISALEASTTIGAFNTQVKKLDLSTMSLQFKKTELTNTMVSVLLNKSEQANIVANEVVKHVEAQQNNPYTFEFEELLFANNDLQFNNNNQPKMAIGFDNNHLHLTQLGIAAANLSFTQDTMQGTIHQLAFKEQSGFVLKKLQTHFLYHQKGASLSNLLLETDQSLIQNKIAIRYPSLQNMAANPGNIFVDAVLNQSKIAVKDILTFLPSYANTPPFAGNQQAIVTINGSVSGLVKQLQIPSLQLGGIGSTSIAFKGSINGLPNINSTYFNFTIASFKTTKTDLLQLMPKGALPNSFNLPQTLAASGTIKGNTSLIQTKMLVQTSSGNVYVDAAINLKTNSYNAQAMLKNVDAGYLLKQSENVGKISMNIDAQGVGFNPKQATAIVKANVFSAFVKGYTYTNLRMDAGLKNGELVAKADMKDANIGFSLDATANFLANSPSLQLKMKLDTLNLYALQLMRKQYSISGEINANLNVANLDSLVGNIQIQNLVFTDSGQAYKADSLSITATADGAQKTLAILSPTLQLQLNGQYRLTEIATALQQSLNRYYALPGFKEQVFAPQDWTLYVKILPTPTLFQLMPSLKGSDSIRPNVAFNSSTHLLEVAARAPTLVYGTQKIDSLTVIANATSNALVFAASIKGGGSKDFYLNKTNVSGSLANNILNAALDLKDAVGVSKYQLATVINQIPNGVKIELKPDLLLDYNKWVVGNNNYIQYDATGVVVSNFTISNQSQSLSINSRAATATSPIELLFKNFNISTLTSVAAQKDLLADGTINGNVVVNNVLTTPIFTTDLTIQNLSYKKDTVGNLTVKVNNQTANAYDADVTIKGNGNDVQLNGKYYTGEGRMDLQLNIANINLATIKKFSAGQLTDASGSLKGNIAIKGTTKAPSILGDVRFNKAYITPTLLGERFFLSNESIVIATRDIIFDRFTILDSAGNKALIDGNIYTNNFSDFRFDMDVTAKNFRAINAPKASGKMFYGKLHLDADIRIRGTVGAPLVKGNIKANKETDFVLVLPNEDPELQSRDGVVKFVDKDAPADSTTDLAALDSLIKTELKGIDLSANIETDTAAQFTMVIDEANGDALKIKGKADLATSIDRSGKLSLTGSYEVQGGSYQLTFNVLKRRFDIVKGSTITWTGDPKTANVNISAVYIANAAPIDLVQSQIQGQADVNRYKQKIPFNVFLNMDGELLKPAISFDIALQPDKVSAWKDIDTKLEQVRRDDAEMNKQVFALLLLNRFVAENPFQTEGAGTTAESLVRQSASRLLTEQLNQLAGNLIQGVDINFGVNSETAYNETNGQLANRTDLNVGISKRLLNDRLRVTVGSNFEIEGPKNQNEDASNIGGDAAVDYSITKDGRYLIRAYRKNKFEGVVEGQIVESGVSFILNFEYDEFKELFKKATPAQKAQQALEIKEKKDKANAAKQAKKTAKNTK